jgi:deazaflavin-dependent oxidoreductase (nitroreductase family)
MNLKDEAAKVVTRIHETVVRASGGRLLGRVGGMPVVILGTTGRKTGKPRTTMLTAPVVDGDRVVLVASWGGDDRHPLWYRNLEAHPDVELTIDGLTRPMRARTAGPEEKAALWPRVVDAYKGYAGYQRRTDRDIPLVVLEPRA